MEIPKNLSANLLWRQELRENSRNDLDLQQTLYTLCSQSIYFWINAFVWTYHQKTVELDGNEKMVEGPLAIQPMVTWPCQDEAIADLMDCITNGEDANMEKSRDMGATWLVLAIADWFCTFKRNVNPGAVSRKEDLVDKKGDLDSLFEKVRFIHTHMPAWLRPRVKDRYLLMQYVDTGSTLAGESTNKNVGRGGRKTFYFVDEAAVIPNDRDVDRALSQNTSCQVWVSTPGDNPSCCFFEKIKTGRGRRIILPWYRHPEKGRDSYQTRNAEGKIIWTSPWKKEVDRKCSRKTVAREVEMCHEEAGSTCFDIQELERHRLDHVRPPLVAGELEALTLHYDNAIKQTLPENSIFQENVAKNRWKFWVALENNRPPQDDDYIFGVDISQGSGDSNSIISVLSLRLMMFVAKFWDSYILPEEFAEMAVRAGNWFGGTRGSALMVYENNGPGGVFGRKCQALRYPYIYKDRKSGAVGKKRTGRLGWHSSPERKNELIGMYRDGLATDRVIQTCNESINEASNYIFDSSGVAVPASLLKEVGGGRALHGDHVIADALTLLGLDQWGRNKYHSSTPFPQGSYGYRREQRRQKQKKEYSHA